MKTNQLYSDISDITIESYLNKYGITDISEYLHPTGKYLEDPMLYDNMDKAIKIFKRNYELKSDTYILCDSGDSDGILSTTIIYKYMKLLNKKWNIKILIHNGKERGLDDECLMNRCVNNPRPLLIIPDAGTNNKEQVKMLNDLGTDVIILDHHNLTDPVEQNDKIVLISDQIGSVDRCGSGAMVTHHFVRALDIEFEVQYSKQFIDIASLSIMSDGMDIKSMQNRTYMYYGIMGGLKRINNKFLKLMITELLKEDYLQKDINFTLVPKINSVCRGDDQQLKQDVICSFIGLHNNDKMLDVLFKMKSAHTNQQNLVNKFIEENIDKIDTSNDIIIYVSDEVPRTYSGLVAGKIKDAFDNKPTIISYDYKSSDVSIGSLRSDVPLQEILNDCEYVIWSRGHSCQCGIKFKKSNIQNIIDYINGLKIDYKADRDVLISCMVNSIPNELYGLFEPYMRLFDDNHLKYPLIHIKQFKVNNFNITVGKMSTIRFKIGDITFIKFFSSKSDKLRLHLDTDDKIDMNVEIIGEPVWNIYKGKKYKQIMIKYFEVSEYKQPRQPSFEDIFGYN